MSKRTHEQSFTALLADLLRAMVGRFAVTITYAKIAEPETVRTLEVHDMYTTGEGRILVLAVDHSNGSVRTFRPEKITSYTLHRGIAFVMAPPAGYDRPVPAPCGSGQVVARELGREDQNARPAPPAG